MHYIDTASGQYPVTEREIKLAYPNVSFSQPFVAPEHYALVFEAPRPEHDTLTQTVSEIAPVLTAKGHFEQQWEVVALDAETVAANREARNVELARQVDAERDRRIAAGFVFQGNLYQTARQTDRENILGAAPSALAAIVNGAQPGDLRWADPEADFFWIASDNSRTPMDAQTTLAFSQGAMAYKTALIVAGSNLKSMESIPTDYTDDKWWL